MVLTVRRSFYLELPEGEDQFSCSSVQKEAAGPRHGCLMLPYCDYINHNDRPTGFQATTNHCADHSTQSCSSF